MDEQETSQGFSPKKVVAGAALGVAVPAAVAVAKKLVGGNGDGGGDDDAAEHSDEARDEPVSRERRHAARATSKSKSAATRTKQTASRAKHRTRDQLYKQATRLKIEGRSSMNKAQLERAVDRAKQKTKAR
jgi:hypothetical protein